MKRISVLCCFFVLCQCSEVAPNVTESSNKLGKPIPSIDILLVDSTKVVNIKDLPNSAATVILFLDPYCPYCRAETESIIKGIKRFKNTKFVFLTIAPLEDLKRFYKNYGLDQYHNIHVGIDTGIVYAKYFDIKKVPHTSLYGKNDLLMKVFAGASDADQILSVLK